MGAALAAEIRLSRSFALPTPPLARKSTPWGGSTADEPSAGLSSPSTRSGTRVSALRWDAALPVTDLAESAAGWSLTNLPMLRPA